MRPMLYYCDEKDCLVVRHNGNIYPFNNEDLKNNAVNAVASYKLLCTSLEMQDKKKLYQDNF